MQDEISEALEKHWSALPVTKRAELLGGLGIDGNNDNLDGKTIDEVLASKQDDLPAEVRGRLIMSITKDGLSPDRYLKVKKLLSRSETAPPVFRNDFFQQRERGN